MPDAASTRGRRRQDRRLELTPAGKVTAIALAVAFSLALPESSNPVLFVVCCLAGTALVAMAVTCLAPSRLGLDRHMPARVFCGESFRVRLVLRNLSRWRPALGLGLRDALQVDGGGPAGRVARLPAVPPLGAAEMVYERRMQKRGVYPVEGCRATTSFPFGLAELRVRLGEPGRLVVLPAIGRLGPAAHSVWDARPDGGATPRRRAGGEEEFHSLTEYRPGDNPRLVHWKTTARARSLMRRVLDREAAPDLHVVLDTEVSGIDGERRRAGLERAVSCAATLLVEAARQGRRGAVHYAGGCASHAGAKRGLLRALEQLAAVAEGAMPVARVVERAALPRRGRALLLSLAGEAEEARGAAAARGVRLHVQDVAGPSFGSFFGRR